MNSRSAALLVICGVCGCHVNRAPPESADAPDGGIAVDAVVCDPDAGIGQAVVATAATVLEPQQAGWTVLSSSTECAALKPRPAPAALSWNAPPGISCDRAVIDGSGTLAFSTWAPTSDSMPPMFIQPDGTAATFALSGASRLAVSTHGFWLFHSAGAGCALATRIENGSTPSKTVSFGGAHWLTRNPRGGYVDSAQGSDLNTIQMQWLDDDLQPLGDWHAATTRKGGYNADVRLVVDSSGHALVLERDYPPGFGPPPDPASWIFVARWMSKDGPTTDTFEPVAPEFMSSGRIGWGGWMTTTALVDGGVASFQPPDGWLPGVTLLHPGWYAVYPTDSTTPIAPPGWVQALGSAVSALDSGNGYVAASRDPATCALTAMLISPSGETCYTLPLEHSAQCGSLVTTWPDGTVALENPNGCDRQWWPGVACSQ